MFVQRQNGLMTHSQSLPFVERPLNKLSNDTLLGVPFVERCMTVFCSGLMVLGKAWKWYW